MVFERLKMLNPLTPLYQFGFMQTTNWTLAECPPLTGKTAVVTGGQSGIGAEIVNQLLLHGIEHVVVLARSRAKFDEACEGWDANGRGSAGRVEFVECDLTDLVAVERVGKELVSRLQRLDMLFLNAAISNIPSYELSPQGIDTIFAANHLGHFHLTNILLPLLISTPNRFPVTSTRIIVTSSSMHALCRSISYSTLSSPEPPSSTLGTPYTSMYRYGRSKLANILFTRALSKRLPANVFANAYFPGNIPTPAMATWKGHFGETLGSAFAFAIRLVGQTLVEGAATGVFLAAAREVECDYGRGGYWVPVARKERTSGPAEDEALAEELWVWSEEFVNKAIG